MQPTSTAFTSPSRATDEAVSVSTDDVVKTRLEHQRSIHGAVIALSFGIALTVILVIFAACHCCRGRPVSRKRRQLHVDTEADYLVDGMYL